jgi:DNA-binding response OmpR family regulator
MVASRLSDTSSRFPTILVVDDDPAMLTLCTSCLGNAGFSVLQAGGSAEAQAVCEDYPEKLDLIVLDLVLYPVHIQMDRPFNPLPRMHGDKLLPILRAKRPLTRVLLMSATSVQRLGGRGMGWLVRQYPFLPKPFTAGALVNKVTDVLNSPIPSFKPSYGAWQRHR